MLKPGPRPEPRRGREDETVPANRINRASRRRVARATRPGGFTLIETSLATLIVGIGVLAMVDAQSSFIVSNQWSSHAASATFLANEIRELTRNLPKHDPVVGLYLQTDAGGDTTLAGWGPDAGETTLDDFDDIDDFDGITFSWVGTEGLNDFDLPGPINAFREVIPDLNIEGEEQEGAMFGWSQTVLVRKVAPFDFGLDLDDDFSEAANGSFPGRAVDEYPLRVTVQVFYQGVNDIEPTLVTEVMWIVP